MGKCWPLLLICLLGAATGACRGSAGKFCEDSADCRPDLVCRKGGGSGFGVCDIPPGGPGALCLRSAECAAGLRCSSEEDRLTEDGRHGRCEPLPSDLRAAPSDAGADLAPDAAEGGG